MANVNVRVGFTPVRITDFHLYVIKAADTNPYKVGDVVKSFAGADAQGIPAVTLCNGAEPVRGVIIAVAPALPSNSLANLVRLVIPAVKAADYYVWVDDYPDEIFTVRDDGTTPANLIPSNVGKHSDFLPYSAQATGDISAAALQSSTFGAGSVCTILGFDAASGSTFAAFAKWRIKFALHELGVDASAATAGSVTPTNSVSLSNKGFEETQNTLRFNGHRIIAATPGATSYTLPTAPTDTTIVTIDAAQTVSGKIMRSDANTFALDPSVFPTGFSADPSKFLSQTGWSVPPGSGTSTFAALTDSYANNAGLNAAIIARPLTTDVNTALAAKADAAATTTALAAKADTTTTFAAIGAKYTKPVAGIDFADLSSAVDADLALAATAYQKPGGGIPASDLDPAVVAGLSGSVPEIMGASLIVPAARQILVLTRLQVPANASLQINGRLGIL